MFVKHKLNTVLIAFMILVLSACGGAEERKANYLEKGKAYLSEKNYDKARIEFKNVLQIDPKFAEGYYYMGQLEEFNKDLPKAVGNYLKALELNPSYIDAKIKLAKIYAMVGSKESIDKAKEFIKEILAIEPGNNETRLLSYTLEYNGGSKEKAVKEIEKIINENPDLIDGVSLLAAIYSSNNEDEKAISLLENAIRKNNEVPLKVSLYKLYSKNKMFQEAEKQLLEIIVLDPDNFSHNMALSYFYATTNRIDDAEKVLREAINQKPYDANRYLILVEFLSARKGIKEAESELINSIGQNPDLSELKFALAEFYKKINKPEKVIEVLTQVINSEKLNASGLKARINLAEFYISNSNYKTASTLINQVLEENPSDNTALYLSAKIAYAHMDDATTINALRTVLKNEPKNSDAALLLAMAHERNGESELARETLLRTLEIDPINPKNHINQANYQASKGRLVDALQTLDKALAYFKNNYDLLDAKFRILASNKDEQGMLKVLQQMKAFHPQREEVYMNKGQYHFSKKQFETALEEYKLALKNSSTIYKPLEAIAQTYFALGRESDAEAMLNERIEKNKNDVFAHQVLGQIYARKDKSKALEHFEKAMTAQKWEVPYISAASIHASGGDNAKALQVLEQGVAVAANPTMLQMQIASIYEREKRFEEAIGSYEKILATNPTNQLVANNLASLLTDFRDDAKSHKRALELAKGFDRTNQPAFIDTLGWVMLKNNDAAGAVTTLQKAVELAPNVGVFQYHLGVAYHQSGNTEQAKRHLTLAVESKQEYNGKDKAREILATL